MHVIPVDLDNFLNRKLSGCHDFCVSPVRTSALSPHKNCGGAMNILKFTNSLKNGSIFASKWFLTLKFIDLQVVSPCWSGKNVNMSSIDNESMDDPTIMHVLKNCGLYKFWEIQRMKAQVELMTWLVNTWEV